MDAETKVQTIGVIFIAAGVSLILVASNILDWLLVIPTVLTIVGAWISAVSLKLREDRTLHFGYGLILFFIGLTWIMGTYIPEFSLYPIALLLLGIGAIVIVSTLKRS